MTNQMAGIDYSALAKSLLANMGVGMREKDVPSSTPTTIWGHGAGGLFSHPAMERPVFSAMQLPRMGLQTILPAFPSNITDPLYGIFTGVTATTGSEPTGVCDDPPVAGLSKLCKHTFVFGRQSRMTRVFDIDRAGLRESRGEHMDFQFMGDPFQTGTSPQGVPGAGQTVDGILNNEARKAVWELAVAWARDFATDVYVGNPANNTAGGGRKYFHGLDRLINTGYRDAESGVACPAADSIVQSFANVEVLTNGQLVVQTITDIWRRIRFISNGAGLDPATWAISMTWGMFYALSDIWPCAYMTYRCANAGTFTAAINQQTDSALLIKMRDEMRGDVYKRTGQYLLIDGEKVPVIIDDAVTETVLEGASFSSTIYFVPLTVLGGQRVTYFEYVNYDMAGGAMDFARALAPDGSFYTSDSGRFLWHRKPPNNFCVQMLAKTEPRLLLLTPHIAARLTNVKYTPLNQVRSPFTDNSYFVDGGGTSRIGYGPSYYTPTA